MFHVGQKVVCVDDKPRSASVKPPPMGIVEGEVYTVREVVMAPHRPAIYIEEIHNPMHPIWGVEWAYMADRFRPVKTTNIDVFLSMLAPTRISEPVP